ncbi:MAG: hypothetical protein ABIQ41_12660 [Gemmatimonadales bacterium]
MHRASALILSALFLGATSAAAQQAPQGCHGPRQKQFDFWVGSWEVTDSAGGTVLGINDVTSEEQGCLIHEHWVGSRGGTGQSFDYFDRPKGAWQQDWVGSGGDILHLVGQFEGGAMVLEGDAPAGPGVTAHHRAMWIPQPDGRVRQYWRQTTDGGKTWTIAFDGWYRKRP